MTTEVASGKVVVNISGNIASGGGGAGGIVPGTGAYTATVGVPVTWTVTNVTATGMLTPFQPKKPRRSKMRMVLVPPNSLPKGHPCSLCGKAAKPGQRVLYQKILTEDHRLHVVIHEKCAQGKIGTEAEIIGSPSEKEFQYNTKFNAIRDNIERDDLFT